MSNSNLSTSKRRKLNDADAVSNSKVLNTVPEPEFQAEAEEEEEDYTSSSGSDSDSNNDTDEDTESNIDSTNINTTTAHPPTTTNPTTNPIHTRLTSFFSQLAEQRANTRTSSDQPAQKIEIDSDSDSGFEDEGNEREGQEARYIELDLALGVLSEKGDDEEEDEVKVREESGDVQEEDGVGGGEEVEGEDGLAGLTDIAGGGRKKRRKEQSGEKRKVEEVE